MKIVILNECFFENKHIDRLKKLGDLTIYNDTDSEEKAVSRLKDADIAIADTYISPFNKKVLSSTYSLKLLALNSIGFDPVDLETANKKGIKICNIPDYCSQAVAEHVIALMFAVIKKISLGDREMKKHSFEINPGDKKNLKYLGYNIQGKIIGVVGVGNIGSKICELARGLGMRVIAYSRKPKKIKDVDFKTLKEVLQQSDVISINMALCKETEKIVGAREFGLMKRNAVFINTARGKLIDTDALYEALKNNRIAGAGLDTISDDSPNHPIFKLENVVLTPHIAWFTEESLTNLADSVVKNVECFVKGRPINIINNL